MKQTQIIPKDVNIKSMIYEIRGQKVMLDSDLAKLYGYEVKRLNEQVQRNIERFPDDFMFQLNQNEVDLVRSQIATSRDNALFKGQDGGRRYLPYVFTEQGVYALSAILKGPLAVYMTTYLIRAFKELKDFYNENQNLLNRVIDIESRQIEYKNQTDTKFDQIFDYISEHKEVKEKVFYKGQIYDAYSLVVDLIKKAKKHIILIDNYVNKETLDILRNKNMDVSINIYTSKRNGKLYKPDIDKFNEQYSPLTIYKKDDYHDRFLILDNKYVYLIGSSLKDVGKRTFGIIEIEDEKTKWKIISSL